MRHLIVGFGVALAAAHLTACSAFDTDAQRAYDENARWKVAATYTTGDVRIVSERTHPKLKQSVVCAEPSPDVAKALSTVMSANAQATFVHGSGGVGASGGSAEAAAELAGRSTALLGLRDGLFRACEAYANGALGQAEYALIVSRYSQLMTTLFLGQDITGAAGAEGKALATSQALQALGASSATSASPTASSKGGGTTTTTTTKTALKTSSKPKKTYASDAAAAPRAVGLIPAALRTVADDERGTGDARLFLAATQGPQDQGNGAQAQNATQPTTGQSQDNSGSANSAAGQPKAASGADVSTAAALSLVRMNEDYMRLGLIDVIFVGCINEYDTTRVTPPSDPGNAFLRPICTRISSALADNDTTKLGALYDFLANIAKNQGDPVKPEAAATQLPAATTTPAPLSPQTSSTKGDPLVYAVQKALQGQTCAGCARLKADGVGGPATQAAVRAYQKSNHLTVNGDPKDVDLLHSLHVTIPSQDAAAVTKGQTPRGGGAV